MIKKIAIVPYVTNGRNSQVGHDGHFNIFKKNEKYCIKKKIYSLQLSKKLGSGSNC